jgi:WD40 repeat protein
LGNPIFNKRAIVSTLVVLMVLCGLPWAGAAVEVMNEDSQTWHLPDGATARLGRGSFRLSYGILAYSPDGRHLAVATNIGVWLYEMATLHAVALLPSTADVDAVVFSPDGGTLATGSWDRTVRLWDVATRTEIASLERHRTPVLVGGVFAGRWYAGFRVGRWYGQAVGYSHAV